MSAQTRSPERALKLQQYWILHSQLDNIRRRLSNGSSTSPPPSSAHDLNSYSPPASPKSSPSNSIDMSCSSESSSVETSPTLQARNGPLSSMPAFALPRPVTSQRSRRRHGSSRSPTVDPIPEHHVMHAAATFRGRHSSSSPSDSIENDQLFQINHDIKTTLTDLLNCEAVRHDSAMRLWVQTKLMDAELELKRQRKRRISAPSIVVSPVDEGDRRFSA
ncbi:hypothetical protein K431DRAFT_338207 [Polychaeton citri CBS 116435]|uniref:Uncharacterized protein n=1 Tax=Polychaeton citri CBS 116435 TaxID=1314669 RepID=A0A9P4Q875_9PEZI|nr:hypothetical protein K431DRAFT_338207 [Polychaeton citri CBS 116435]